MQLQFLLPLALCAVLGSVSPDARADEAPQVLWDIQKLSRAPQTYPAPELASDGVQALFFEGLPWKGKPTRVFAYIGIPPHQPNEKVPGIVLVHGGGGTAFASWVRLWNSRGYAAIAMDHYGTVPNLQDPLQQPKRHEMGGPSDAFAIDEPIEDQWQYHAIADVLLSAALLRARPEVDANRIGITGISWGGYLTCIASGVDSRWKFAVPVYGCGFLSDNSVWLPDFERLGKEKAQKWVSLWDPSKYLGRAKMPFLWVDGTNDFAYPLDSLQKSYRLLKPEQRALCTRVRMAHGHGGPGENPEEIHAFADAILKGGAPLAHVIRQQREGSQVTVSFESAKPIVRAELNFTKDAGPWTERKWETVPAQLDEAHHQASAELPAGTRVYYLSLIDEHGLIVSSEHNEL
jgi:dienelactone hydrolase